MILDYPRLALALCVWACGHTAIFAADDVPHAYRSLIPGQSTIEDVIQRLGPPPIATQAEDDLRYPVAGQPTLSDRLFFRGGRLALVTAASEDARYLTREQVMQKLGQAEATVQFQTQQYMDYSTRGLKFICDREGTITGVIYFAPSRRRVPEGHPSAQINLRRSLEEVRPAKAPIDFRVGAAEISITPQAFDMLLANGAGQQLHVAEDLMARVVAFAKGDTVIALIGLDVFGLGLWDVAALVESARSCGCDEVIVAMSHTHANVDTIGFYGHYPRDYVKHILQQSKRAVAQAVSNLQSIGRLEMATTEMPLSGGRVVDLVRNGRDPGLVDPTVSLLRAVDRKGGAIVNVVHLACHPEVIKLEHTRGLSPDFVGTLCKEVTKQLGGQTVFLNGALGGMLTPDTRSRTQDAAIEMGRELAKYVVTAAGQAEASSTYDLWFHRRSVECPITSETLLSFLQNAPGPVDLVDGRVRTEMNVLWIGDAQFITVPGEMLPDIGLEITSRMRGRLRAVVGLANGELGYLVPAFDFRAGEYEERTGPGAEGGPITRAIGLELAPLTPPTSR